MAVGLDRTVRGREEFALAGIPTLLPGRSFLGQSVYPAT